MAVKVLIPSALKHLVEKNDSIELDGNTVGEIINNLAEKFPQIKKHLFKEDGSLRSFVNIYVNGEDIKSLNGNNTKLKSSDSVMIVPSIAGGKL